ncbi:MAG: hypothetical protein M3O15_11480, partial [Acidobacteriota bacterium]|nr:hypothetical protein [Acidobacteriota bacterium]
MPISSKNLAPPVQARAAVQFDEIVSCLESNGRGADPDFLRAVYNFSAGMHKDQVRRSGEPYL